MPKIHKTYDYRGYHLRPGRPADAEDYFETNFCPPDPELIRLTGSKPNFSREEVVTFFQKSLENPTRYDFYLVSPGGRIVGESVLNEIDRDARSANYRIAIFDPRHRNRGLGTWMVRSAVDFAFRELGLHRLSLEVFAFNHRARKVYESAGFTEEGRLRDGLYSENQYHDIILMSILEDEWRSQA